MITKNLATRLHSINYDNLPESTKLMAKKCILDWLGCSIRGWTQPSIHKMAQALGTGNDEATLFNGTSPAAKNSALYAGMLNAAASHSLDFDDLHNASIVHAGCITVPAAFALAEELQLSGQDIITSVVAGYEAGARIGESINPESYYFWHTTAVTGTFSSGVTAAKLLKLDVDQIVETLGSAGTQSAGLWEFLTDGAMSKTLHTGKAVFAGILSARLAQSGFTAAKNILEGEKGFCRAFSPDPHRHFLTDGPLDKYKIDENSFKPYACCKHTHPANYAAQLLKAEYNLTLDMVKSAEVKTNTVVKNLVDNCTPQNPYGSKFSIQYCIAAMLKYGKLGIDEFTMENLADKDIQKLMPQITVIVDEKLEKEFKEKPERWAVQLTIEDINGNRLEKFVECPKGDPPNPMTWEELEQKFIDLVEPCYGKEVTKQLCSMVGNMEDVKDFKVSLEECFKKSR